MDNIGTAIVFVSPDLLHFDRENPRMVEFTDLRDEEDILNALWDSMAVSEIVMSILANGFFQNEPLYVIPDSNRVGDYIVIEGNRRLAAIRAILYPTLVKSGGMKKFSARITSSLISHINAGIPVVIMQNRADSWRLIGFKHVNGAAKWDSYAKAEYIAQIHNIYGVSLEDIAEQIGDSNRTTIKLYQALMVLNQAEKCTSFRKTDIYKSRLYFSYLFSALGYSSVQDYLCIASPLDSDNPVPESNYHELEELMMWLFGSRSNDIKPIITSQSRHLGMLNQVLSKPKALEMLRLKNNLEIAIEYCLSGEDALSQSLGDAETNLEKAMSKVSKYEGGRDLLETALALAKTSQTLFNNMKSIYDEKKMGLRPTELTID